MEDFNISGCFLFDWLEFKEGFVLLFVGFAVSILFVSFMLIALFVA